MGMTKEIRGIKIKRAQFIVPLQNYKIVSNNVGA